MTLDRLQSGGEVVVLKNKAAVAIAVHDVGQPVQRAVSVSRGRSFPL